MLMFGDAISQNRYLYRTTAKGERVKSQLLLDFEALARVVDLSRPDAPLCHCYCVENSIARQRGAPLGSKCCDAAEEEFNAVLAPVLNFLVHRAQDTADTGRWTYLLAVLKQIVVGYLCGRVLPRALQDMKIAIDVKDTMEEVLTKLVNADLNDLSARKKTVTAQDLPDVHS